MVFFMQNCKIKYIYLQNFLDVEILILQILILLILILQVLIL